MPFFRTFLLELPVTVEVVFYSANLGKKLACETIRKEILLKKIVFFENNFSFFSNTVFEEFSKVLFIFVSSFY